MQIKSRKLKAVTFRAEGIMSDPVHRQRLDEGPKAISVAASLVHDERRRFMQGKLGVISDRENLSRNIDGAKLIGWSIVDAVVYPEHGAYEDMTHLYRRLLGKLELEATQVVAVETGANGLVAAQKLGCYTVALAHRGSGLSEEKNAGLGADAYMQDFEGLQAHLREILFTRPRR